MKPGASDLWGSQLTSCSSSCCQRYQQLAVGGPSRYICLVSVKEGQWLWRWRGCAEANRDLAGRLVLACPNPSTMAVVLEWWSVPAQYDSAMTQTLLSTCKCLSCEQSVYMQFYIVIMTVLSDHFTSTADKLCHGKFGLAAG